MAEKLQKKKGIFPLPRHTSPWNAYFQEFKKRKNKIRKQFQYLIWGQNQIFYNIYKLLYPKDSF